MLVGCVTSCPMPSLTIVRHRCTMGSESQIRSPVYPTGRLGRLRSRHILRRQSSTTCQPTVEVVLDNNCHGRMISVVSFTPSAPPPTRPHGLSQPEMRPHLTAEELGDDPMVPLSADLSSPPYLDPNTVSGWHPYLQDGVIIRGPVVPSASSRIPCISSGTLWRHGFELIRPLMK